MQVYIKSINQLCDKIKLLNKDKLMKHKTNKTNTVIRYKI